MKCIYCGKELAEGELFCSACGKAVQIVPDYNVYDDDYLKEVLAQENPKKPTSPSTGRTEKETDDDYRRSYCYNLCFDSCTCTGRRWNSEKSRKFI